MKQKGSEGGKYKAKREVEVIDGKLKEDPGKANKNEKWEGEWKWKILSQTGSGGGKLES